MSFWGTQSDSQQFVTHHLIFASFLPLCLIYLFLSPCGLLWTHTSNKALAYTFFYYWNTIALQSSVSFFCTTKWISYLCTYSPSPGQPLPIPAPIPPITEHRVVSCFYSRLLLAACFTQGSVYMSVLIPQYSPTLPSPSGSMPSLYYCPEIGSSAPFF